MFGLFHISYLLGCSRNKTSFKIRKINLIEGWLGRVLNKLFSTKLCDVYGCTVFNKNCLVGEG